MFESYFSNRKLQLYLYDTVDNTVEEISPTLCLKLKEMGIQIKIPNVEQQRMKDISKAKLLGYETPLIDTVLRTEVCETLLPINENWVEGLNVNYTLLEQNNFDIEIPKYITRLAFNFGFGIRSMEHNLVKIHSVFPVDFNVTFKSINLFTNESPFLTTHIKDKVKGYDLRELNCRYFSSVGAFEELYAEELYFGNDTTKHITTANYMFSDAKIDKLDIKGFDLINVKNAEGMFFNLHTARFCFEDRKLPNLLSALSMFANMLVDGDFIFKNIFMENLSSCNGMFSGLMCRNFIADNVGIYCKRSGALFPGVRIKGDMNCSNMKVTSLEKGNTLLPNHFDYALIDGKLVPPQFNGYRYMDELFCQSKIGYLDLSTIDFKRYKRIGKIFKQASITFLDISMKDYDEVKYLLEKSGLDTADIITELRVKNKKIKDWILENVKLPKYGTNIVVMEGD